MITSMAVSGCSIIEDNTNETTTVINDAESFEGTIHIVTDESLASSEYLNASLEAFDALHTKWTITFDVISSDYTNVTSSAAEETDITDIYIYNASVATYLASNSYIAEIGGDTLKMIQEEDASPLISAITYQSAVYGVPYTAKTNVLYYDTSVFEEDDVKSLESILKKGKIGIQLSNSDIVSAFYLINGLNFDLTTDTEITNYLLDMTKNKNYVDTNDVTQLGDGVDAVIASTDSYEEAHAALGNKNLGVAILPTFKPNDKNVQMKSFIDETFVAVNPNSSNIKIAVALAQYLGSSSCSKDLYDNYSMIGANRAIEDEDFLAIVADALSTSSTSRPSILSTKQNYYSAFESMGQKITASSITSENAAEHTNEMITSMTAAIE